MSAYPRNTQEAQSVLDFLSGINASLLSHKGRVEGEVTSVKNSYQTAIYFSIKDLQQDALLNCVIWRTAYNQNGVAIKEGDKIIVTGVPEIYPARGSFSMKVHTIEYAGEGALKKSYDELKLKLEGEGLLATARKRPLPQYPKKIGVITSRSGVVIQDFNANLGRYGFQITMVDSRVEGKDAIHELLAALKTLATQDIEVLVIMRGGGSWESLQAFNTESVVRAIAGFPCPVLTGIGHDVDVTLAELVADVGTSTPTAVAEALNETWDTLRGSLMVAETRIMNSYQRVLAEAGRTIEYRHVTLLRRFDQTISVGRRQLNQATANIQHAYRALEKLITQANTAFQQVVSIMRSTLKTVQSEIVQAEATVPRKFNVLLRRSEAEIFKVGRQVLASEGREIVHATQNLTNLEQRIKIADPSRNLKLGYSLSYVRGKLVRSVQDIAVGDTAEIRICDGSFISDIKQVL